MQYRSLGASGPRISVIGFGCAGIGGAGWADSWGPQDDTVSTRAIHTALEHGVTLFDTAPVYGLGHAEEVLGRALGKRRHEAVIATKYGLVWDEQGRISRNAGHASIMREVEASLRRLGTDYIDLYQLHWPDTDARAPIEETMQAMDELVRAGKVHYAGVCNVDVPLLQQARAVRDISSVQPPYNLLRRDVEGELLPFCRDHGIGVVAFTPLAAGLLGGRYDEAATFPATDWRSRHPDFMGERLRRTAALARRLEAIAARGGRTTAQLAIAWVLANPAVTSAIVGARRPDDVIGAALAGDWRLDADARLEIEGLVREQ